MFDSDKIEAVRQLSQNRQDFKEFFRILSSRQRNRSSIDIDSLVKNTNENIGAQGRKLAIEFFRKLEEIGVGDFKVGRRGMPTRFIWSVPMLEVIEVAQLVVSNEAIDNGLEEVEPLKSTTSLSIEEDSKPKVLTHKYILRQTFTVTINLPVDLTGSEADRLSAFIKTLPLE